MPTTCMYIARVGDPGRDWLDPIPDKKLDLDPTLKKQNKLDTTLKKKNRIKIQPNKIPNLDFLSK